MDVAPMGFQRTLHRLASQTHTIVLWGTAVSIPFYRRGLGGIWHRECGVETTEVSSQSFPSRCSTSHWHGQNDPSIGSWIGWPERRRPQDTGVMLSGVWLSLILLPYLGAPFPELFYQPTSFDILPCDINRTLLEKPWLFRTFCFLRKRWGEALKKPVVVAFLMLLVPMCPDNSYICNFGQRIGWKTVSAFSISTRSYRHNWGL